MLRYRFYVVGCGGTGSLLARDLAKLLTSSPHTMTLIDGDVVEEKNIIRQGYQLQDIGENKAAVLSKKINALYNVDAYVIDSYLTKNELLVDINKNDDLYPVILGCVDNDNTRVLLENTFKKCNGAVYIDSANGEYEGNIYITRIFNNKQIGTLRSDVYKLSNDHHPLDKSCQDQAADGNIQYLVTNTKMAIGILEHCNALLENRLKEGVQIVKQFKTVFYTL